MWATASSDPNHMLDMLQRKYEIAGEQFVEDLMYGLDLTVLELGGFGEEMGELGRATLCLHSQEPRFLVLTRQLARKYHIIDPKVMRLREIDQELESLHHLERGKYLILEDEGRWILTFRSQQSKNLLFRQLRYFQRRVQLVHGNEQFNAKAMKLFCIYNRNGNDTLQQDELRDIVTALHLPRTQDVQLAIRHISPHQPFCMTKEQYQRFMELVDCRLELEELYYSYCNPHELRGKNRIQTMIEPIMTEGDFRKFQLQEQRATLKDCQSSVEALKWHHARISFSQFSQFMFSRQNWMVGLDKTEQYQNMDHPLSQYFVKSSHNTYLSGNQLTSKSMASRYVQDLYRGIRCIELDTHDGSQGPIIKHGYTITSAITFKSVIEAINEFSVLNPKHFPIILSLENHCGINNQIVMATIIEQTLKDRLFVIPRICSNKDRLPSPNQLRGKVIIQGTGNIEEMRPSYRKEQLLVNARTGRLQRTTKFVPKSLDYPPEFLQKKANFKAYRAGLNSRKQLEAQYLHSLYEASFQTHPPENQRLSNLFAIIVAKMDLQRSCYQMANLSESLIPKTGWQKQEQLVEFSKKSLIRVYPEGLRFDSSNYDPIACWECGAQLVSMNAQSHDPQLYINISNFIENGDFTCGYLLKPQYLRTKCLRPLRRHQLKLRIISCSNVTWNESQEQMLPMNIKVMVSFYGSAFDMQQNPQASAQPATEQQINANYHIVFKQTPTLRYVIEDMHFAFIYVEIPGCGRVALPIRIMRSGTRTLSLLQPNKLIKNNAYVLARVDINELNYDAEALVEM